MKLKKWLAVILAVTMAVGTLGAFAGCGEDDPAPGPGPGPNGGGGGGGGDDDTAIQYYLVGKGLGTLAVCDSGDGKGWDNTCTDESLKFTRTGNTATITADLYEGDEFKIIHNQDWAGEMGFAIVANAGVDADEHQIFDEGGLYGGNIILQAGYSGKYKLTLTLNSETDFATNSLTWECLEHYDVVFATWYDSDDVTEIAKTVVVKGTTTTAYTYGQTLPRFYEFKNWVTKDADGETVTEANFTQPITENVKFYARVGEMENAAYQKDATTWTIKKDTVAIATFALDEVNYKQHNVFTVTHEFEKDETFTVTNGTVASGDMTTGHASYFKYENGSFTVKTAGNYEFTLITEVTGGTVTVKEFIFHELLPTYSGLAVVGTFNMASNGDWLYTEGVNPKMVETGESTNVFKATITFDTIPEAGKIEIKVATIVKNALDWNSDRWGTVSGAAHNSGGNCEITEAGTYTITLDKGTNTLSVIKTGDEYFVVGDLVGASWSFNADVNPQLIETGEGTGIYTCTLTITKDATEVKVAVVANGAIQWTGKPNWGSQNGDGSCLGGGNVSLNAGTYTVTLNTNTNVLTFTLQQS